MCAHIHFMLSKHIVTHLYERRSKLLHTTRSTHSFNTEMIAAHTIAYHHIKRCCSSAFLYISTHMEARSIRSSVHHFVDGPLIAMIGEYNRRFLRKVLN